MAKHQEKELKRTGRARRQGKPAALLHVRQCCSLAMAELVLGSGPEWRRKIENGICRLHGRYSQRVKATLSGRMLEAWKDCSPTRFGKRFGELTEAEVGDLAHALAGFIVAFLLEEGERGRRSTE